MIFSLPSLPFSSSAFRFLSVYFPSLVAEQEGFFGFWVSGFCFVFFFWVSLFWNCFGDLGLVDFEGDFLELIKKKGYVVSSVCFMNCLMFWHFWDFLLDCVLFDRFYELGLLEIGKKV